ncbi:MAG: disulfide bond formation protein DsbA [Acidimicrobiia bacterium]|nr:disulfide bond formation protein DsbA [Acidimicrobiia bacterium]
MTARWVVDAVAPERDLSITWQPISLLEKNQPAEDSEYYAASYQTHRYLRVMESVRAAEGDDAVFPLYWEYGRRIHHDRDRDFPAADALKAVGLDERHAAAFDDETWDEEIKKRMAVGIELAGEDIGTPIIAFDDDDGQRVGLFGPVITRVPTPEQSLRLWDSFIGMATVPGFWELKRTRTERPEFGERP